MSSLDRRSAADLAFFVRRDGPERVAEILIGVATAIGFRGLLEEQVFRHVRRPRLRLLASDGDSAP
jgi:hypothetical protein